jgi:ABC-type multidrug transport system ATPase subunit/multidrug efflux pump subunit AcrB
MPDRRTRRGVIAVAIVLLACVAAPRLRLDYVARVALPELTVALALPPSAAADPAETASRWLVPIESAIRSAGDVIGTRGEVSGNGARLMVRFRSGVDPQLKTARLLSDLATVRASLPRDAQINVWPSTQSGARPDCVIALQGASDSRAVAAALQSTAGVRDASVWGGAVEETAVRLRDDAPSSITADDVRSTITESLRATHIGAARTGARTLPLDAAASATRVRDVRVGTYGITSIADVRTSILPPDAAARLDGRPAMLLFVFRDENTSLFAFDRAVRDELRRSATQFDIVSSDAADLRRLLIALALGAAAAMLLFGAYTPVAIAIAVNAAWLLAIDIDAAALIAAAIAIAGVAPIARMRRSRVAALIAIAAVAMLPVAITLGSSSLAPFLIGPARAFAIAGAAGVCAALLMPVTWPRLGTRGAIVRRLLRNAPSVVLFVGTAAFAMYAWFGTSLDPRDAGRTPERGRLYARLLLPAGSTLAQTTRSVEAIEATARSLRSIKRVWSIVDVGSATTVLELSRNAQSPASIADLREELGNMLTVPAGAVSVDEQFDRSAASRVSDDLEERPETNESGTLYRIVMHGTSLDAMRRTADAIEQRLRREGNAIRVHAEWGSASRRIELVPNRETTPALAAALAAALIERTIPPRGIEMSDGRILTVAAARAPRTADEAPRARDLFALPLRAGDRDATVLSAFTPHPAVILGSAQRELGRFVLPITMSIYGADEDQVLSRRATIDRTLRQFRLPADVSLSFPSLSKWSMSREKLRAIGLAALLPLLLYAIAAIVLGSTRLAIVALAPAAAALAVTSATLLFIEAGVDEATLFAMSAAACCVTAHAITALRARGTRSAYRMLRTSTVPALAGTFVALAMLAPASMLECATRGGWRAPLIASSTMLGIGNAVAPLLAAAITIVATDVRRRTSKIAEATRRPLAWSIAGSVEPPTFAVQNVTKIYSGGFRALHRVSFELRPGVVGLLGPNGAGKTTLLRILTGLLLPTRGEVLFRGVPVVPENLADYRRVIGFLPQEFNAWSGFTAEEFLDFWAIERGIEDARCRAAMIARVLAEVDLTDAARRRVRDFSGGMRQRVGIARALLGDPPVVIADEPTTGLDIESRARFRDLMRTIAANRIVILSTHIAGDVEATASRILLLDKGTLRYDGAPDALIVRARGRVFEEVVSEADARDLSRRYRVTTRVRTRTGILIRAVVPPNTPLPAAAAEPTLEEAYLADIATRRAMKVSAFGFLSEG